MMNGSLWWNILFGVFGWLLAFLLSFQTNMWQTSIMRACLAFIVFFCFMYAIRKSVYYILKQSKDTNDKVITEESKVQDNEKDEEDNKEKNKLTKDNQKQHEQDFSIDRDEFDSKQTSEIIRSLIKDDDQ